MKQCCSCVLGKVNGNEFFFASFQAVDVHVGFLSAAVCFCPLTGRLFHVAQMFRFHIKAICGRT